MTNINELRQMQRVTKHYEYLQGLRQVPFAILFLCIAIWRAGWWPWFENWRPISAFLLLGVTIIVSWQIGKYYERTFGKVRKLETNQRNEIIAGLLSMGGIFFVGWLEQLWNWPISGTGLFIAILLIAMYVMTGRFRVHFLFMAIVMALLSLLPLINWLSVQQLSFWNPFGAVGIAILGTFWLIGGLVDHWYLVRALGSDS